MKDSMGDLMKKDFFHTFFNYIHSKGILILFTLILVSFFSSGIGSLATTSNNANINPLSNFQKLSTNTTAPAFVINQSTFLGGNSWDFPNGFAIDPAGNTYITGSTQSTDFPTKNAYNSTFGGGDDAFVTKFNSSGALVFSTYFGGSGNDTANKICVDTQGNIYIIGQTDSTNFPTKNAFDNTSSGGNDVFIAKFNSTGSLLFSTYFGGSGGDIGKGIAVDSADNIYISGNTISQDFPLKNPINKTFTTNDFSKIFIAKFNATGSLLFSTYFGGSSFDSNTDLAVDGHGNIFITGFTVSSDFPMMHAYNSTYNNKTDSFISEFNSTGSLLYSTYFSEAQGTISNAITVDTQGNFYITGAISTSTILTDVFVAKFTSSGSLAFVKDIGGSAIDAANDVVVDTNGNSYIVGDTFSTNFPLKNAYNEVHGGSVNVFVAKFDSTGNLTLDTLIGGSSTDAGFGIGLDSSNNVYIMGFTTSNNYPTKNAYQSTFPGSISGFMTKFSIEQVVVPISSSTIATTTTSSKTHTSPAFTLISILILPIFIFLFKRYQK